MNYIQYVRDILEIKRDIEDLKKRKNNKQLKKVDDEVLTSFLILLLEIVLLFTILYMVYLVAHKPNDFDKIINNIKGIKNIFKDDMFGIRIKRLFYRYYLIIKSKIIKFDPNSKDYKLLFQFLYEDYKKLLNKTEELEKLKVDNIDYILIKDKLINKINKVKKELEKLTKQSYGDDLR